MRRRTNVLATTAETDRDADDRPVDDRQDRMGEREVARGSGGDGSGIEHEA